MKNMLLTSFLIAFSAPVVLAGPGSFLCKADGVVISANIDGELNLSNFKVKDGKSVSPLSAEEISLVDGNFSFQAAIVTEGDDFTTYRVETRKAKNGVYKGSLDVNAGEIFEPRKAVTCSVKFVPEKGRH